MLNSIKRSGSLLAIAVLVLAGCGEGGSGGAEVDGAASGDDSGSDIKLHTVEEGEMSGDGLAGLPGTDDPAWDHERLERMKRLDSALSKLSDEHSLIVLLHDAEGYKLTEIQELIGVPIGTVKSRLHRARGRLREILTEDGTFS